MAKFSVFFPSHTDGSPAASDETLPRSAPRACSGMRPRYTTSSQAEIEKGLLPTIDDSPLSPSFPTFPRRCFLFFPRRSTHCHQSPTSPQDLPGGAHSEAATTDTNTCSHTNSSPLTPSTFLTKQGMHVPNFKDLITQG